MSSKLQGKKGTLEKLEPQQMRKASDRIKNY